MDSVSSPLLGASTIATIMTTEVVKSTAKAGVTLELQPTLASTVLTKRCQGFHSSERYLR